MGSLMSSLVRRYVVLSVALAVMAVGASWAATTGKIAGRVTDANSGQPIPGVAVVVDGLRIGATTDSDGNYFVIGIPPGTYSVRAAIIGYTAVTTTRVVVNIERTTRIDYELDESAIEVAGVTVVADREIIRLDVGSSQGNITREDMIELRITSTGGAIGMAGGGSTMRSGLAEETQLYINGHAMTDMRLNTVSSATIPYTSVQEVQVVKSGFNAEYGNARSGIINVVTRDDPDRYWLNSHTSFTPAQKWHWTTDAYGNPAPSAYGPTTREWQLHGSEASIADTVKVPDTSTPDVLDDSLAFVGWINTIPSFIPADRRLDIARRKQQYWLHRHGFTEDDYANKPSYSIDASIGGPIPLLRGMSFTLAHMNSYSPYQLIHAREARTAHAEQLTLTYRLGSAKLSLIGAVNADHGVAGASTAVEQKYAVYKGAASDNSGFVSGATFTHVLSTATQYEFAFDYQYRDYLISLWPMRRLSSGEVNPEFWDRSIFAAGLTADSSGWLDVNVNDPLGIAPYGHQGQNANSPDEGYRVLGTRYNLGGATANIDSSYWDGYRLRGSLTSQITRHHHVKAGFEGAWQSYHEQPQFQVFSDKAYLYYNRGPFSLSGYAQDRIEYEGMILNLGLRLDHFNARGHTYNPDDMYSKIWSKDYGWQNHVDHDLYHWLDTNAVNSDIPVDIRSPKTHTKLSPRLAMSHPVTDNSKVFFNYGHFHQYPPTVKLYTYGYNAGGHGVEPTANPSLDMPRTIQYELGLSRLFSNRLYAGLLGLREEPQYLLTVAGYYKDIVKEVGRTGYYISYTDVRNTWENKAYAQIRGVEIRFEKRVGRYFMGWLHGDWSLRDYGSVGYAKQDEFGLQMLREDAYQQTSIAEPSWSIMLELHTPRDFSAFGLPASVSEAWYMRYSMGYRQGQQATYNPNNESPPPAFNVRHRDSLGAGLSFGKGFSFGGVFGEVTMSISNLWGRKTLNGGSMTGNEWRNYMRSLHFPIDDGAIETDPGNDRIGDVPEYAEIATHDGWANFTGPRSVSFSAILSFN